MGTRVSALSTVVYSTMYMYDHTDRSNSLRTFTRNASQCQGNHSIWDFLCLLRKSSFYDFWGSSTDRSTGAVPAISSIWMAVLLFGAKPVTGSTSRKWDTTCLALLPRMYSLASLSPRWDSCQIQSIASERSWRDVWRHTAWRSFLEQDYRGEQSYGIPLVVWDWFTIFSSSLDRCAQQSSEISSFLFWIILLLLPRKRLPLLYSLLLLLLLLLQQPGQARPAWFCVHRGILHPDYPTQNKISRDIFPL